MGELGAARELQLLSTYVLSGFALHVHAKRSFPPAAPPGCGPQAEPEPLEGIWRTSDQWVAGVWAGDEPALPACPTVPSCGMQQEALSQCLSRSVFLQLPLGTLSWWFAESMEYRSFFHGWAAVNGQQWKWSNAVK